ncbi:hypothetical protein BC833DRAFT_613219 [Globomyces pollinis-pini]|nr:hypothetical protein BC833DRAFT_613219 [Globomyces pollinis-pini]
MKFMGTILLLLNGIYSQTVGSVVITSYTSINQYPVPTCGSSTARRSNTAAYRTTGTRLSIGSYPTITTTALSGTTSAPSSISRYPSPTGGSSTARWSTTAAYRTTCTGSSIGSYPTITATALSGTTSAPSSISRYPNTSGGSSTFRYTTTRPHQTPYGTISIGNYPRTVTCTSLKPTKSANPKAL